MKNLELKIYEKLGIRKFRNILLKIVYLLATPFMFKTPKEERKTFFHNLECNYFMKKGNGLKDLKDFKKYLYFNAGIHIIALIAAISSITGGFIITGILLALFNSYCIMLQRYNYIRINNTIKKFEEREKKKIENIKEEIKDNIEDAKISVYNYKKNISEKNKTLDDMLNNLSLKHLKELKKDIEKRHIYKSHYLCATFFEDPKKYKINTKIKQKNR